MSGCLMPVIWATMGALALGIGTNFVISNRINTALSLHPLVQMKGLSSQAMIDCSQFPLELVLSHRDNLILLQGEH